jgi:hypothetical protein
VENPRVMAALRRYADEAKPVPSPDVSRTWNRYSLSFQLRSGRWTRHLYLFDSHSSPAYIETTAGWFELSDHFNALISTLAAHPDASPKVDADDEAFLRQHGWTALFPVDAFDVTIPPALKHRAGEYPVPIYWAYHNELSKSVGLDLTPFLGRPVQVRRYRTVEPLPKAKTPGGHHEWGCAVIIRHDGRIVGAWMQYYGLSCSVTGRWFDEVAGSWDAWIPSLIDPDDPKERALASLAPEELIRSYYLALERRDFAAAGSYLSRRELMKALFSSPAPTVLAELYSPGFPADFPWDVASNENTISAKVVAVTRLADLEVGRFQGILVYRVELDLKVKRIIAIDSGRHSRYFFLVRETPTTGWRINGQGPGEQPLSPWEATGP